MRGIASLSREIAVRVPLVPSFLRSARNEAVLMPIEALTEAELRELGRQWTNVLVAHAAERRKPRRKL